jgi:hypothetical protein
MELYEEHIHFNGLGNIRIQNSFSKLRDIIELINKCCYFTMRHQEDINELIKIVGNEYLNKIKLELCPTIWYSTTYIKNKLPLIQNKYIAIEIKDDREWRRYYKITKNKFYFELEKFVQYCLNNNINIAYLSHDGSNNFYNYLKTKNINIPYIDNSVKNENEIYNNYNKIKTLICSAGHSQMISYSLGIDIITLVSHPKTKNFCNDIKNKNFIEINEDFNIYEFLIKYFH